MTITLEETILCFKNLVYKNSIEIYNNIKIYPNNINDIDDIYSLGMIELIKCYRIYDKSKSSFSTLLYKSLKRLKDRLIRDLNTKKRKALKRLCYLNSSEKDIVGIEDNRANEIEFNYDILSKLDIEERKIVMFLMERIKTKKEFAQELGIARPTLNARIKRVKNKLYKLMIDYNIDF